MGKPEGVSTWALSRLIDQLSVTGCALTQRWPLAGGCQRKKTTVDAIIGRLPE
jgi:hypothetical protein